MQTATTAGTIRKGLLKHQAVKLVCDCGKTVIVEINEMSELLEVRCEKCKKPISEIDFLVKN